MKIEIGESLCYSYLRHVKRCWLVQTNWKTSEYWGKKTPDTQLESLFESMRERFDPEGNVFKQTKDAAQFLKQGEIDIVGVEQDGSIHAMEVAFHEHGLNYGGGVANRVTKKLLRAVLILKAYHPTPSLHLYFASPKVHPAARQPLTDAFSQLEQEYPEIKWRLLINDAFTEELVGPTLERTRSVADASELFARAAKLLKLSEVGEQGVPQKTQRHQPMRRQAAGESIPKGFQDLVKALMKTLLEDHQTLLEERDLRNLTDSNYCKNTLGIKAGNFPLLRRASEGRKVGQYARYYAEPYADEYYLCNHFAKTYHLENAASFIRYLDGLVAKHPNHPGRAALEGHRAALQRYVERATGSTSLAR